MNAALTLALLLGVAAWPAQAQQTQIQAQATIPQEAPPRIRREPPPRPRSNDPLDRAYLDGGIPTTPGFSGFGGVPGQAPSPRGDLAPRPNLDMELRAQPAPPATATLSPTMIHPRLPGRGAATDGAVSQREQRLLQGPAPGARLSMPMTW